MNYEEYTRDQLIAIIKLKDVQININLSARDSLTNSLIDVREERKRSIEKVRQDCLIKNTKIAMLEHDLERFKSTAIRQDKIIKLQEELIAYCKKK